MNQKNLKNAHCEPCQGGIAAIDTQSIESYLSAIDSAWQHQAESQLIMRSFKFKNFAKTMFFVNALAQLSDQQGHHPDVEFGYNYCRVKFTTHEAKGLSVNDFICAKKVDGLL